ncbi:hypothetical protein EKE94_05770 [Mesobaculum littorinae]|uniref:Uncharacterized protein n=1 Tax=Mesobaculum littorinae TaxID=2486419 RepID=A0A438AIG5_9RHOB|nr:hypothetical protein [Mesobaculum littorinae]RVV98428.1 hypothetical protein EKE94_05770 [Mesobaculum littorinae]
MTALAEYEKLEARGLWRVAHYMQRREVVVSFGSASLILTDMNDVALAHWSLPAIERRNPGQLPALYTPGADASDELEIDDPTMIDAIEKVRSALARRRPRRGWLRRTILTAGLVAVILLAVFWLPDAIIRHTVSVVPQAARAEIGAELLSEIQRISGPACTNRSATAALRSFSRRIFPDDSRRRLLVLPGMVSTSEHLPGGLILIDRALIEDYESPEPAAGFVLAEMARADAADPLAAMLEHVGPMAAVRLLTRGHLTEEVLRAYAEDIVAAPPQPVALDLLLPRFAQARISVKPYAYALDLSGESVLELIEADPVDPDDRSPVLSDRDWVLLQGICGE